jgi:hypothetical protein
MFYDTLQAVRRCRIRTQTGMKGNPIYSLAFVVDALGIEQMKTAIYPREHWVGVWAEGKKQAECLDNIEAHCIGDVIMTERVALKLLKIDTQATIRRFR